MTKILLVEDDPAIQVGLKEILLMEGYEVIASNDGRSGMELALTEKPDLLLLDLNLPSLNGLEITKRLREKSFLNPIIMLTSNSGQMDKIIGLEMGADDYITKPFDTREVIARIRANIRKHKIEAGNINSESSQSKQHRHLQTVLFSDIVNYSGMMNKDEKGTLKLLNEHNSLMEETISFYKGRIVEIIGDAILATFESAVDSAECSLALLEKFKERNNQNNGGNKIRLRIGIHLGDIIELDNKIKGDAVNIAARIQQQCLPGKIYISRSVCDIIRNKVKCLIVPLGKFQLKNITDQIELFELLNKEY